MNATLQHLAELVGRCLAHRWAKESGARHDNRDVDGSTSPRRVDADSGYSSPLTETAGPNTQEGSARSKE
jgi:hypothetical protein